MVNTEFGVTMVFGLAQSLTLSGKIIPEIEPADVGENVMVEVMLYGPNAAMVSTNLRAIVSSKPEIIKTPGQLVKVFDVVLEYDENNNKDMKPEFDTIETAMVEEYN